MAATRYTDFALGKGNKAATATAGAATLDNYSGVITTEALSTAAAGVYTLTLTNPKIKATDIVMVNVANGTNSAGAPTLQTATPSAGSLMIRVANRDAAAAFNGTLLVHFFILRRE